MKGVASNVTSIAITAMLAASMLPTGVGLAYADESSNAETQITNTTIDNSTAEKFDEDTAEEYFTDSSNSTQTDAAAEETQEVKPIIELSDEEMADDSIMLAAMEKDPEESDTYHVSTYDELVEAYATASSSGTGTIYLEADIALASSLQTSSPCAITIDGNGYTITRNDGVCTAESGQEITFQNMTIRQSATYCNGQAFSAMDGSTINWKNVKMYDLTGQSTPGVGEIQGSGVINMYDGTFIEGSQRTASVPGVIQLRGGGTFNMHGGTITNCTGGMGGAIGASPYGLVAYAGEGGTFNMYGGEISNCAATSGNGGGAFYAGTNLKVTMNMYGGTIKGCSGNFGSAIGVGSGNSYFNMYGGEIIENNGKYGTVTGLNSGHVNLVAGSISNNTINNGYGGAVMAYNSPNITIGKDMVITGNQATGGGAVCLLGGQVTIEDGAKIYENYASQGSDIITQGGTLVLGTACLGQELPCGGKVDGWYWDDIADDDGWQAETIFGLCSEYAQDFVMEDEIPADTYVNLGLCLKAAHGDTYAVTYKDSLDPATFEEQSTAYLYPDDSTPEFTGTIPNRAGYKFAGWSPEVNDKVGYIEGAENRHEVYIAQWEELSQITVTFVDGTDDESVFETESFNIYENEDIPIPSCSMNPTREGYKFTEWDIQKDESGNLIYTATWAKLHKVKYQDGANGEVFEDVVFPELKPDDDDPVFGEVPVRFKHRFDGWKKVEEEYDIIYIACWTKLRNVTYVDGADGIVFEDRLFENLPISDAIPSFGAEPQREGYSFEKWNITENGDDLTFIAIWSENELENDKDDDPIEKPDAELPESGETIPDNENPLDDGKSSSEEKQPDNLDAAVHGELAQTSDAEPLALLVGITVVSAIGLLGLLFRKRR